MVQRNELEPFLRFKRMISKVPLLSRLNMDGLQTGRHVMCTARCIADTTLETDPRFGHVMWVMLPAPWCNGTAIFAHRTRNNTERSSTVWTPSINTPSAKWKEIDASVTPDVTAYKMFFQRVFKLLSADIEIVQSCRYQIQGQTGMKLHSAEWHDMLHNAAS